MSCSENRQSRHKIIFSSSVYRYPQNAGRVAIVCVTQNRPFLNHAQLFLFAPQFKPRLSGSPALLPKSQGLYAQRPTRTRWKKPNRTLDWKSASALVGTTRI